MSTEIEKLPRLIERAASALAKATNAGEILEAKREAEIAYNAAKLAARFLKIKDAHATVLAACHRAQADALVIEARAQCRLADEYDAAQERGELSTGGNPNLPNRSQTERLATVEDVGLTRKQVHEARLIRDAEKAEPGIVRQTLDEQLEAGEEPTRSDVKRATRKANAEKRTVYGRTRKAEGKKHVASPTLRKAREIVRPFIEAGKPVNTVALEKETGISHWSIDLAIAAEKARMEGIEEKITLDPSHLSKTAQEKLEAAIRAHKHRLDEGFSAAVNERVRRFVDEVILPDWREKINQAHELYARRRALMDKDTFNTIRRALHPDSRQSISDAKLGHAFDAFMALEKYLLNEKDSPTQFGEDLPDNLAAWDKMRAAARRSKSKSNHSAIRRR